MERKDLVVAAVLIAVAWSVYDLLKEMAEAGHLLAGILILILTALLMALTYQSG